MPGKFFEELNPGDTFRHGGGRTITEADNVLFCAITMNSQPLHVNADYAAKHSPFGRPLVNGLLTMALAVGMSVADLTEGTLVANLGYDSVRHPHPMFHGDTLYAERSVVAKRDSRSHPEAGIVSIRTVGRNQEGVVVLEFARAALILKRPSA